MNSSARIFEKQTEIEEKSEERLSERILKENNKEISLDKHKAVSNSKSVLLDKFFSKNGSTKTINSDSLPTESSQQNDYPYFSLNNSTNFDTFKTLESFESPKYISTDRTQPKSKILSKSFCLSHKSTDKIKMNSYSKEHKSFIQSSSLEKSE